MLAGKMSYIDDISPQRQGKNCISNQISKLGPMYSFGNNGQFLQEEIGKISPVALQNCKDFIKTDSLITCMGNEGYDTNLTVLRIGCR